MGKADYRWGTVQNEGNPSETRPHLPRPVFLASGGWEACEGLGQGVRGLGHSAEEAGAPALIRQEMLTMLCSSLIQSNDFCKDRTDTLLTVYPCWYESWIVTVIWSLAQ